nr:hypothetical protein [Tanacetum cinerariifolium]
MGWDTIQLENSVSTISQEYLLEFTSEYGIPESLHLELPGPKDPIVEFREDKVDEKVFPTIVDWRTNAPKEEMPFADFYSAVAVATLNTRHTPIEKRPEALLCLVRLSQNYFLGDDVHPTFLFDDDRGGYGGHGHGVRVLGTLAAIEKSPLDFANEDPPPVITERGDEVTPKAILESGSEKEAAAMGPVVNKGVSTLRGKSLTAIEIEANSTGFAPGHKRLQ